MLEILTEKDTKINIPQKKREPMALTGGLLIYTQK